MSAMQDSYHNQGVHVTGGTVNGPVAAGQSARATQYGSIASGGGDDLAAALAELRQLIKLHAEKIDDPENALRDVDEVEVEAGRDKRDPQRLRDTLVRLGRRVGQVGVVATALFHIQQMARDLLP
jgi:hypothetical protein